MEGMLKSIETVVELETIYAVAPSLASTAKEIDHLIPEYRALIEASPFMALATVGPEGLDCSPRGDVGQVVHILSDKTLALPDRRGNNRIDSLRNILRDARVALLFLIPGEGTTLRVNGRARIIADPAFCQKFVVDGKAPRTVIVIEIERIYFQCARAVIRAGLWNAGTIAQVKNLPTPGAVLQKLSAGGIDGEDYDRQWPERAKHSMW
jgi:uncharacterized protein